MGKHTRGPLGGGNVLEGIARLAIRAPRQIIAIALLVMAGAAVFGIPVAKSLSAGGFDGSDRRLCACRASYWPASSIKATCRC